MFAPNVERVLKELRSEDVVLDIGGWACPFNRANFVIDAEAFETRGYYKTVGLQGSQGGDVEHFTRDTWFQRDICSKEPFPFSSKQIDLVICSHVLEDIRDPIWVCSEMIRIAKKGYIEVPSRLAETCRGWESSSIAGLSHHRWLIDISESARSIRFVPKFHMIHSHPRYNLSPRLFSGLSEEKKVSWLFWDDSFEYSEVTCHGLDAISRELEGFSSQYQRYPAWKLGFESFTGRIGSVLERVVRR